MVVTSCQISKHLQRCLECPGHSQRMFHPMIHRKSFTSFDLDRSGEVWFPCLLDGARAEWENLLTCPQWEYSIYPSVLPFAVVLYVYIRCIEDQEPKLQFAFLDLGLCPFDEFGHLSSWAIPCHVHDMFSAGLTSTYMCAWLYIYIHTCNDSGVELQTLRWLSRLLMFELRDWHVLKCTLYH